MNNRPLVRKILYLVIVALLLVPMPLLSMPLRRDAESPTAVSGGGKLAQLRHDNKLSQGSLGKIDPSGEAIKLASLGLQNVASMILWERANECKKKENWTELSDTLNQLTMLQPNYSSFWEFQGWNLSYNVSAEFDDYRDRYFWVMEGIRFLKKGTDYNADSPRLLSEIGRFLSQKIGRADEHVQFRRLFVDDADFHGTRPRDQRDNWLVGRESYLQAESAVNDKGASLGNKSPVLFFSDAPRCRINYATALEEDGNFDEKTLVAWQLATRDWQAYGNREFVDVRGDTIRLEDLDTLKAQQKQAREELDKLPPTGLRELIRNEKREKLLSRAQRDALDVAPDKRDADQAQLAAEAEEKLNVTHDEVAARVSESDREKAKQLAEQLARIDGKLRSVDSNRNVVNYRYWLRRCQLESTANALDARRAISQADKAFAEGELPLPEVRAKYEEGFAKWTAAAAEFPDIFDDSVFGQEMLDVIKRYRTVLERLDQQPPEKFPLYDIVKKHER